MMTDGREVSHAFHELREQLGRKFYIENVGELTLTEDQFDVIDEYTNLLLDRLSGLTARLERANETYDPYNSLLDILQGTEDIVPHQREIAPGYWLRTVIQHAEPEPSLMALCTKPYEEDRRTQSALAFFRPKRVEEYLKRFAEQKEPD